MLTFPYAPAFLSDLLRVGGVTFQLMRFEEQSGSGDGRIWTSELARPLWQVNMPLARCTLDIARKTDARIRALQGSKQSFLWADPSYRTSSNPGTGVTISAISADRSFVSFAGLPPYYALRAGDRFSIEWGSGRHYLAEVAEDAIASSSGAIANVSVMPFLPLSISVGAAVNLRKPTLRLFVPPNSYSPYQTMLGNYAEGASLTLLQRI